MATYAIGDIQGCYQPLLRLLEKLGFSDDDRLWLVGDLVNRGPQSLDVLRFVKSLGERAVVVLGNHDLHLLAVAYGHGDLNHSDTLDDILAAPDRDELLQWLRHRPVFHYDADCGYAMVHAGLPPQWDLKTCLSLADELQHTLRGDEFERFLAHMYGNKPRRWRSTLQGWERLRFITNCFTRLRYCSREGELHLQSKGAPGSQPEGYLPWFAVPTRATATIKVVFGHWSTLGQINQANVHSLDSGCVWGGQLTALQLESASTIQLDCPQSLAPGG